MSENKIVSIVSHKNWNEIIRNIVSRYGIVLILIAMVTIFSFLSPVFLHTQNLINVLRQVSIITILAYGVTNIIITTGIDLSSGSAAALVSVVVASVAHPNQFPLIIVLMVGLGVGLLVGFINGFIIAQTQIPPFIATLGMYTAARGVALLYSNGKPISGFTPQFDFIGGGQVFGVPVPIVILAVVTLISHVLLNNTKFGKYTYAIGGNEQAAKISGINVYKYKILIYSYAGLMAGIAGIVLTSRISSGQPSAAVGYELDAIASAVIGGTSLSGGIGTIPGTLIGGLIIGVLNTGLNLLNVSAYLQQIVRGSIIVGAVILDQRKYRSK
jgi:inositol transport system permease protein